MILPQISGADLWPDAEAISFKKNFAELAQFFLADAADAGEIVFVFGIIPRHLTQRHVRENNVGRHVAFVGEFFAQFAADAQTGFRRTRFRRCDGLSIPARRRVWST